VINQSGTVVERNDYYPYGMQMAHNQLTNSASGSDNKRKFSGKELDVMGGLNLYDFEARPYDLNYINFWTPDSKTEKKPWISPYVYCSDNPVNRVDPDGQQDFAIPGIGIPAVPYWPADSKTGQAMVDLVKKVGNFIKTAVAAGIAQQAVTLERATTGKNKQNVSQANEKKEATEKTAKDGKTGARTEPKDLEEQLTLEEAQGGAGESFMKGKLKDKKYDEKTGTHDKMRHNHDHGDGTSTEVHYDKNRATGEGSNYKIKDDTNKNSRGNK